MQNSRLKINIIFLAIFFGVLFFARNSWAANYYFATTGTDNGTCGPVGTPCASFSYTCNNRAKLSGDIIHINAGTYTDTSYCSLASGVKIQGAGKDQVTITTTYQYNYIYATSNDAGPVVDGLNEISGITFKDGGSINAIISYSRSNQKIHDCAFMDFGSAGIDIHGIYGSDGKGSTWKAVCDGSEQSNTWCENDKSLNKPPLDNDWAHGVEIYNNYFKNAKMSLNALAGMKIYNNQIDNQGTTVGGIGHTGIWFKGGEIANNTITLGASTWNTIALELWEISDNLLVHDNTANAWFSLGGNSRGNHIEQYSYQVYNNKLISDAASPDPMPAFEVMSIGDVRVYNNYVSSAGTFSYGVGIWGGGKRGNIYVNNNVIKNVGLGVDVVADDVTADLDNVYIYNNLFEGGPDGKGIVWIHDGLGDMDNINIKNNIFLNSGNKTWYYGAYIYPAEHSVSGCSFTNNIVYNGDGFVNDFGPNDGFSGGVSDNYSINPNLQYAGNSPDPYYRPTAGSNVIDKGTATITSGVTITGYTGTAPDIGAYEYIGAADTTPPSAPTGVTVN